MPKESIRARALGEMERELAAAAFFDAVNDLLDPVRSSSEDNEWVVGEPEEMEWDDMTQPLDDALEEVYDEVCSYSAPTAHCADAISCT